MREYSIAFWLKLKVVVELDGVEEVHVLPQLSVEALGRGEERVGSDDEPAVLLDGAHVLEVPHPQAAVGHVEEQRVFALDGRFHARDQQDAQVLGAAAEVFGVDALVVAGEGEDLEALPGRLLEQLHGGVADEVVRVFPRVDVEICL